MRADIKNFRAAHPAFFISCSQISFEKEKLIVTNACLMKKDTIYLIFWDRRINVILRHKFRTRIPDFSRNHHGTGLGGSASFDAGAVFFRSPIHGA